MLEFPVFEGYAGFREFFTFRENAALTIPKRIRQLAYSLQVDIEITSTSGSDYKNFKSSPPHSFYGYAVIVFRDHSQIQIPIEQARQVLYYDRVVEAYANWWNFYLSFISQYGFAVLVENQLNPIAEALGLTIVPNEVSCPTPPTWEELPIREVYIKTKFGTQFKVEISWFEPVPVVYGECEYYGSSQFADSSKDEGLPSEGTQPNNANDPNNPYAGLPPASTDTELGDFANSKLGSLDDPNPDNQLKTYLGVIYTTLAPEPTCTVFQVEEWFLVPDGAIGSTRLLRSLNPVCGGQIIRVIEVFLLGLGTVLQPEVYALDGYTLSTVQATTSPPNKFEQIGG